jgi:hypothetical protein
MSVPLTRLATAHSGGRMPKLTGTAMTSAISKVISVP